MPEQFYNLTLYEYRCILAGHLLRNAKSWEHTRLISYTLYSVNSTKKVSIEQYMPLLTDPVVVPIVITKEDREEMMKKAQERLAIFNR